MLLIRLLTVTVFIISIVGITVLCLLLLAGALQPLQALPLGQLAEAGGGLR